MDTEITRSFELMRFSIWENVLNGVRLSFVEMEWPEIWDVEEGAVMLETDDNTQKPFVFGFSALSSKFL
jgi:hypothetical protein